DRLGALAEGGVDPGDLLRRERRTAAQPQRRVHVGAVEGRRARGAQAGEVVGVARCRGVRGVGGEGGELERERAVRGGGLVDERRALGREHVGQVGGGRAPVVNKRAVLVEVV